MADFRVAAVCLFPALRVSHWTIRPVYALAPLATSAISFAQPGTKSWGVMYVRVRVRLLEVHASLSPAVTMCRGARKDLMLAVSVAAIIRPVPAVTGCHIA
eukprot:COSAG01_NODE_43658_length_427_cov_1.731707_1_plen_100_part_10